MQYNVGPGVRLLFTVNTLTCNFFTTVIDGSRSVQSSFVIVFQPPAILVITTVHLPAGYNSVAILFLLPAWS